MCTLDSIVYLFAGHNVAETDAAQRDETEVTAVHAGPTLPVAENRAADENVPAGRREWKAN